MLLNNFADLPPVHGGNVSGWKTVPVRDNGEKLVPLGPFSDYPLVYTDSIYGSERTSSPYADDGLSGSLITMFVRAGVAAALTQAQSHLPAGYFLAVCDSYRPLAVQASLYQSYHDRLRQKHPGWSDPELSAETQRYVSIPSTDPRRPSPHNTGGAVDVVLMRLPIAGWNKLAQLGGAITACPEANWQPRYRLEMAYQVLAATASSVDFGTPFDHGGAAAAGAYYEQLATKQPLNNRQRVARDHRRLLAACMVAAGFSVYADEWWHFNLSNQMDACATRKPVAMYGGIELTAENHRHEAMRRQHRRNVLRLAAGERWIPPAGLEEHFGVVLGSLGPINQTNAGLAERIAPPA